MIDTDNKIKKHISTVKQYLFHFAIILKRRGVEHDASKFFPIERDALIEMDRLIATEGNAQFGSEEYERRKGLLGPMLEHHYKNNSHHPEHYENGVAGMDLFDLVEMFADWKAASERGEESSMNLGFACKKYSIPPMLESILRNTAKKLEWRTD